MGALRLQGALALLVALAVLPRAWGQAANSTCSASAQSLWSSSFNMSLLNGTVVTFDRFAGKVGIVVNVASF